MGLFTPDAWEGVSVVTVVIIFFLVGVWSLIRGWIIFGPAHRAIVKIMQDGLDHANGREFKDAETIAQLTSVIAEQRVSGEVSAHIMQAIRDATQQIAPRS